MQSRRLIITPGEPAGIGPDICVQLAQLAQPCELIAIASPELLQQRAAQLNLPLELHQFDSERPATPSASGEMTIIPCELVAPVIPGVVERRNSAYLLQTLRLAAEGCLRGDFDALITGPVHKGMLNESGFAFTGHTEFFAELSGVGRAVMVLATADLRVALATTHLPLSAVSHRITRSLIEETLQILHHGLQKWFGIANPQILICGLNPHAGEGGSLGREELEVIGPSVEKLRRDGMRLTGPLSADTLFTANSLQQADAVLAMYHDQGLPVLKHIGFGRAVNITMGLPFIRVSVDHGVALELAGSGRASSGSLRYALETALQMVDVAD